MAFWKAANAEPLDLVEAAPGEVGIMTETKEQSLAPSRWCCQRTRATTLAEWRGLLVA